MASVVKTIPTIPSIDGSDLSPPLPASTPPEATGPGTPASSPASTLAVALLTPTGDLISANAPAIEALGSQFDCLRAHGWAGLFIVPTPLAEGSHLIDADARPVRLMLTRAGTDPTAPWVVSIPRVAPALPSTPALADGPDGPESDETLNAALRAFVEHLPMPVWLKHPDGRVVFSNQMCRTWVAQQGLKPIVGKRLADVLPSNLAAHSREESARALNSDRAIISESHLRVGEEMRWFEEIRAKVTTPDGRALIAGISRDTTDAHAAREALSHSEHLFRRFSELGGVGVWMSTKDLSLSTHINSEFRAQFGLPDDIRLEDAASAVNARIHPDDRSVVMGRFERLLNDDCPPEHSIHQNHRLLMPDGTIRHIDGVAWRILDNAGSVIGVGGVTRDVTAEVQARQTAARSDANFRMAVDSIRDLFWIASTDFKRLTFVNRAFREMLGEDAEAIMTEPERGLTLVDPADLPSKSRAMGDFIADEREDTATFTFSLINRAGRRFVIRERLWRVRDDTGRTLAIAGLGVDVTAETTALRQAAESEGRFRSLVESMPDTVTLIDRQGLVLFTTDASLAAGQPIWDWLGCKGQGCPAPTGCACPLCGTAARHSVADRVFMRAQVIDSEREVIRPDGTRAIMSHRIGPVERNDAIDCAIAISRDITDLRAANDRMRAAERELVRAARMRTMGELSTSLAHELNQPLSTLVASCKTLELVGDAGDPAVRKAAMGAIDTAAHRATAVVARMRALASGMSIPSVTMPLDRAIADVAAILSNDARDHACTINTNVPRSADVHIPDALGFQQVLLNLIRNSMEAMESTRPDDRLVTITASNDTKLVMVFVRDFGPGIADDLRSRLFEPFTSTKSKGLGLGLSISRGIVEQQGCKLWIAQNPGQSGACMAFNWPIAQQAPESPSPAQPHPPRAAPRTSVRTGSSPNASSLPNQGGLS